VTTPRDIARAAQFAGCHVDRLVTVDGAPGCEIGCPDRWATVRLLCELTRQDAADPWVAWLARDLVRNIRSSHWLAVILERVQSRVEFRPEPRETFQDARLTWELRYGDCDDSARLLAALALALGFSAALVTFSDPPLHVVAQASNNIPGAWRQSSARWVPERWTYLEATVPANVGESPFAACQRLGLRLRPDLGPLVERVWKL